MEINIRKWRQQDLTTIQRAWLDHCQNATRSDLTPAQNARSAMKEWLESRLSEHDSFGLVAETSQELAGFLIGRINDWESTPPIIKARRVGVIDAVYVMAPFRRQGVAGLLVDAAIDRMRAANAVAVETIYDERDDASAGLWRHAGFAPWMVHAYRML
jgi:ribosomal protein S18 acetylase RimI-like enzyme